MTALFRYCTGVAFWLAVALALAYPAVFVAVDRGLLPASTFFGFLVLHGLSLIAGHGYGAPERRAVAR